MSKGCNGWFKASFMHHQRSQCTGDDEVDNVAAISNVAIMVESSEALNVIDNSTDDIDLPTEADDYVNILVSLK